jgi:hypothetical protein
MDVCAFLGVAPRGPARVPVPPEGRRREGLPGSPGDARVRSVAVPVTSFDEYARLYGRFEGPGRLPYAVASFFEQGGRKAYVVRIVADDAGSGRGNDVARGVLEPADVSAGPGSLVLWARSEGSWGNRLRAAVAFAARPVQFEPGPLADELTTAPDVALPVGSLLRLTLSSDARVLAFVSGARVEGRPGEPGRRRVLTLDASLPATAVGAEVVEATLDVDDGDGRQEQLAGLGLAPEHPRWLAAVVAEESQLVEPDEAWWEAPVRPASPDLPRATSWRDPAPGPPPLDPPEPGFEGGRDGYAGIVPEDFFDSLWTLGDDEPRSGVHALVGVDDVSLVVAPDLYDPAPIEPVEPIVTPRSVAGPEFRECVDLPLPPPEQEPPPPGLDGLALDPSVGSDRERIIALQLRLHDLAELLRSFVVLLDVPPGLGQRDVLRWRARFDSSYAAAFHPWLRVARPAAQGEQAVEVNPAAIAAGIAARRELLHGVQFGPANELAARVVDVADPVSPLRHGELHQAGVNVFQRERDGIRLTAARTLTRGAEYRQLSVRRLMTMLRRVLEIEMQWVAFEPHTASLRADLEHQITTYLRGLYAADAFAGEDEEEAFFVRCDETLNPPQVLDAGQLIVEVGVAPAEPLEFVVLRVSRDGDGTLLVEGPGA